MVPGYQGLGRGSEKQKLPREVRSQLLLGLCRVFLQTRGLQCMPHCTPLHFRGGGWRTRVKRRWGRENEAGQGEEQWRIKREVYYGGKRGLQETEGLFLEGIVRGTQLQYGYICL